MDPPGLRAQGALVTAGVWASSAGAGDHVSPREAGQKEEKPEPGLPEAPGGSVGPRGGGSSHRLQGWKASAGLPWPPPCPLYLSGVEFTLNVAHQAGPEPMVRFLVTSKAGPLSKTG